MEGKRAEFGRLKSEGVVQDSTGTRIVGLTVGEPFQEGRSTTVFHPHSDAGVWYWLYYAAKQNESWSSGSSCWSIMNVSFSSGGGVAVEIVTSVDKSFNQTEFQELILKWLLWFKYCNRGNGSKNCSLFLLCFLLLFPTLDNERGRKSNEILAYSPLVLSFQPYHQSTGQKHFIEELKVGTFTMEDRRSDAPICSSLPHCLAMWTGNWDALWDFS